MKPVIAVLLYLVLVLPAAAQEYRSSNFMRVAPVSEGRFIISGVPRMTPQSYWCAAGEYGLRVLRLPHAQRLYVVGDYQRGQRRFLFSVSPAGTASEHERVKQVSVRIDGANQTIAQSLDDCRDWHIYSN